MWDADKAVLRRKLTSLCDYIRGQKSSKIYYLRFHLNKWEKENQIKPKASKERNNTNKIRNQWKRKCTEDREIHWIEN